MPAVAVQLNTVQGQPIEAGALRLTPESQAVIVRLPFGGLVWHRPTAVIVEQRGQARRRLPILDVTRVFQIGVVLGTLAITAVCLILASASRSHK